MTLFLKSKIRKQLKLINFYDGELVRAVNKYNKLVAEYQGMNFFQPIIPQQQPSQEQQQSESVVKQIITKKGEKLPETVQL